MAKRDGNLRKIILRFKDALSEHIEVQSLILFGSYASGYPQKYSDIDVAVVSPDFAKANPVKNLQFLFKVAKKIDINLEPLAFLPEEIKNPDPRSFESEIVKKGKIVYSK
jgi:predicted nucleotidyltransferase